MDRKRRDQKLRESITHSLREWGCDRNYAFANKMREEAVQQADAVSQTFPLLLKSLVKNTLPNDQVEAVMHVLQRDLVDSLNKDGVEVVQDTIGILWPPFRCQWWDTTKKVRNKGYERFSIKELDSTARFTFKTIPDRQHLYESWSDKDCLGGTIMEAIVSHHVVHSEACFHCKFRKTLRWNGGRDKDSSWADLLCLNCQSTFEIKSKKNPEALEKIFKYKEVRGGSFRLYHANQLSGSGKRYIVLVSRAPNDRGMFPVSIREVDSAEPTLKDVSFATFAHGYKIALGTRVHIKERSALWCVVQSPKVFQPTTWAVEVFDRHFGKGTWDSLDQPTPTQKTENVEALASATPSVNVGDSLEAARRALEDLKTEDWEDSEEDEAA